MTRWVMTKEEHCSKIIAKMVGGGENPKKKPKKPKPNCSHVRTTDTTDVLSFVSLSSHNRPRVEVETRRRCNSLAAHARLLLS
jgi:hypothetical protein